MSVVRIARSVIFLAAVPFGYGYRLRRFHRLVYRHRDAGQFAAVGCAGAAVGGSSVAGAASAATDVAISGAASAATDVAISGATSAATDAGGLSVAGAGGLAIAGSVGIDTGYRLWRSVYVILAVSRRVAGADRNPAQQAPPASGAAGDRHADAAGADDAPSGVSRWAVTAASYCFFGALRVSFYPLPFLIGRALFDRAPLAPPELYRMLAHRDSVCSAIMYATENAAAICRRAAALEEDADNANASSTATMYNAITPALPVIGWRLAVNHDRLLAGATSVD